MPTMMKRKKSDKPVSNATLIQAFDDWNNNDAYVSDNNYRLKSNKGRIAPWNKAIRQWFHSNDHFNRAARHYKATGHPYVPQYVVLENVRITNYSDKIKVEVAEQRDPDSGEYIWADWNTKTVYGWAAEALFAAVSEVDDHPMLRLNTKRVEDPNN